MIDVIITGGSRGLGEAIIMEMLANENFRIVQLDRSNGLDKHHLLTYVECDVTNPESIIAASVYINRCDILINNAGINYIDNMENISLHNWQAVMDTNATAIWLMTRELLPLLEASKGTVLNVVSNACRIPMTHSIVYNASKAAAEMMTRQMARELTKSKGITIFGINPNKLAGTGMSKYIEETVLELRGWTKEQAREYQLKALLSGFETKPKWIAELVVWLLEKPHRHKYLTGCLLDLGA